MHKTNLSQVAVACFIKFFAVFAHSLLRKQVNKMLYSEKFTKLKYEKKWQLRFNLKSGHCDYRNITIITMS